MIVRDYRYRDKWINGHVKSNLGPLTYEVTTESGSVWKRHADQIRDSNAKQTCLNTDPELETAENEKSENAKQSHKFAEEPGTSERGDIRYVQGDKQKDLLKNINCK